MADDDLDTIPVYEPPDPGVRTALSELDQNMAERRFTAASGDRAVTATVDGHTALLDIDIDDSVLRRGHPESVGRSIVEAVTAARTMAAQLSGEFLAQTLDPDLPNPDLTIHPEPAAPAFTPAPAAQMVQERRIGVVEDDEPSAPPPPRRPRAAAPVDEEEEYDPFQGHRDGGSW
jgi:DNA-binding protein YbaB